MRGIGIADTPHCYDNNDSWNNFTSQPFLLLQKYVTYINHIGIIFIFFF